MNSWAITYGEQSSPQANVFPKTSRIHIWDNDCDQKKKIAKNNCNFHYFHLYIKIYYYCGLIPFKLSFNQSTGHYHVQQLNRIAKVSVTLIIFTFIRVYAFFWYCIFSVFPDAV